MKFLASLASLFFSASVVSAAQLNIHFKLDDANNDIAIRYNRYYQDHLPGNQIKLNTTMLPHVTLMLAEFEDRQAAVVAAVTNTVSKMTWCPMELYKGTLSGAFAFWSIRNTPCLQRMCDLIVNATAPFAKKDAPTPAWVLALPEPEKSQRIAMIQQYGTPNAFQFFDPHVTIMFDFADPTALIQQVANDVNTNVITETSISFNAQLGIGNVGTGGSVLRGQDVADFDVVAPTPASAAQCPNGANLVTCFVDPCRNNPCRGNEVCVPNYCAGYPNSFGGACSAQCLPRQTTCPLLPNIAPTALRCGAGTAFPSCTDGCNTCSCQGGQQRGCTKRACVTLAQCTAANGDYYTTGAQIAKSKAVAGASADDDNACVCGPYGSWVCSTLPLPSLVGCYVDQAPSRLLSTATTVPAESVSVDTCAAEARRLGFKYFSLTNGNQCRVGATVPANAATCSSCNRPCQGNLQQTCGGTTSASLYRLGQ